MVEEGEVGGGAPSPPPLPPPLPLPPMGLPGKGREGTAWVAKAAAAAVEGVVEEGGGWVAPLLASGLIAATKLSAPTMVPSSKTLNPRLAALSRMEASTTGCTGERAGCGVGRVGEVGEVMEVMG